VRAGGAPFNVAYKDLKISSEHIQIDEKHATGNVYQTGYGSAPPTEVMLRASALGAFITSQKGACPNYTLADFESFCKSKI
jgi:hypothetical protein